MAGCSLPPALRLKRSAAGLAARTRALLLLLPPTCLLLLGLLLPQQATLAAMLPLLLTPQPQQVASLFTHVHRYIL